MKTLNRISLVGHRLGCQLVSCLLVFSALLVSPSGWANNSGVALQYHRISVSGANITRTSPADFNAHLLLIERLGFPVVPLDSLLANLCDDSAESSSAIAITFDDAHRTVFEQAWPLLKARGWPFVVFVNTAAVDQGHGGVMTWDQLRELAQAGVIIGNHGVDHQHMIRRPADQTTEQWALWRRRQVIEAQQRMDAEVGPQPKIFAYPYGEYDLATASKSIPDKTFLDRKYLMKCTAWQCSKPISLSCHRLLTTQLTF